MSRPFYHDGMRELQDARDGRRVADALAERRLHREFGEDDRALIQSSAFFFIATGHGEYMDCSIRAGDPGFVKILDGVKLEWPEYDGNSMFRTLGNIARNPNVGLLFLRFDGQSRRLRISGRASVHGEVVRVACTEIYPNCPRYVPDLAGGTPSAHVPREGHTPPAPEWKQRDYIRDILPARDPFRPK